MALTRAPFTLGRKEIFLPNFTLTMLRDARLPPTHASFLVPLHMNKLDMRDYLYHAYDVKAVSIRSFIKHATVRQGKPFAIRPQVKRWYRPRASKKMTVEMDRPFVWPEQPADLKAWDKATRDMAVKDNKEYQEARGYQSDSRVDGKARSSMREQALALLQGRERWKPVVEETGLASRRFGSLRRR